MSAVPQALDLSLSAWLRRVAFAMGAAPMRIKRHTGDYKYDERCSGNILLWLTPMGQLERDLDGKQDCLTINSDCLPRLVFQLLYSCRPYAFVLGANLIVIINEGANED